MRGEFLRSIDIRPIDENRRALLWQVRAGHGGPAKAQLAALVLMLPLTPVGKNPPCDTAALLR